MPWGSYGEMLWQGIYCYDKDTNSHMIFRTGAFCPSIYRSQYNIESPVLIAKEDVLQYITESNLTGFVVVRFPLHHGVYTAHWDVSGGEAGGLCGGV